MQAQLSKDDLYSKLLTGAHRIGSIAEQEIFDAEKNNSISQNVVDAIVEEGFNRLIIPKEYGYPQIDFTTFSQLIKTVGYYNLSAAWVTYFYALHNSWVALLPKHRMDQIYEDGGLLTDIFAPMGQLQDVEGGFILNGKWNFVSGINHSKWVAVGALYKFADSDIPAHVLLCLDVDDIEVLQDWDTLGLRGSGSNTIIVKDLFVPFDMMIDLRQIIEHRKPANLEISEDYLYFNVPFFPAFFIGFPSMAIGAAERVVDEFITRTKNRVRPDGTNEGQTPKGQRVAAELTLQLKGAKGLLYQYIEMLDSDIGQYSLAEYNAIRVQIIKDCVQIAVRATSALGAGALKRGSALEVMLRDLIAISTHVTSLYEDGIDHFGKSLFDVEHKSRG